MLHFLAKQTITVEEEVIEYVKLETREDVARLASRIGLETRNHLKPTKSTLLV